MDVACTSYSEIVDAGAHWTNISVALNEDDTRRLEAELDAVDEIEGRVIERIANLMSDWEKGDAWLTDLGFVAGDSLAASRFIRAFMTTGDDSKLSEGAQAIAAANEMLDSVNDRYGSLGLGCSR